MRTKFIVMEGDSKSFEVPLRVDPLPRIGETIRFPDKNHKETLFGGRLLPEGLYLVLGVLHDYNFSPPTASFYVRLVGTPTYDSSEAP